MISDAITPLHMNERDIPPNLGQPGQRGLILYDGVCVLCSNWFRFIARRDRERTFLFTSIQSPYGRALAQKLGIDPDNPDTNAVLLDGAVHLRSDSAIAAIAALPNWGWIRVLRWIPKWLRDPAYGMIARHRYQWFGKRTTCYAGGSEFADRVIS